MSFSGFLWGLLFPGLIEAPLNTFARGHTATRLQRLLELDKRKVYVLFLDSREDHVPVFKELALKYLPDVGETDLVSLELPVRDEPWRWQTHTPCVDSGTRQAMRRRVWRQCQSDRGAAESITQDIDSGWQGTCRQNPF